MTDSATSDRAIDGETSPGETLQVVGFRVDGQSYAFPIRQTREIVDLDQVTRLPRVPDFVHGVSNLRGAVIPIIGLRELFGLEPSAANDSTGADSKTVVVSVGDQIVGCVVDAVTRVLKFNQSDIQPAPEIAGGASAGFVSGLLKRDDELVILLDASRLLDPQQLEHVHELATCLTGDA